MTTTGYNGWTNYATWLVGLWLDNDRSDADIVREKAEYVREGPEWLRLTPLRLAHEGHRLGADLRELVEEWAEGALPESCMMADLLGAAIASVNWDEIGQSYMDELDEAIEYDRTSGGAHHRLCACDTCAPDEEEDDEEEEDAPDV